jgi:hypothetical protein
MVASPYLQLYHAGFRGQLRGEFAAAITFLVHWRDIALDRDARGAVDGGFDAAT